MRDKKKKCEMHLSCIFIFFYLASRIFISHLAFLSRIDLQNLFLLLLSRISNVPYRLPQPSIALKVLWDILTFTVISKLVVKYNCHHVADDWEGVLCSVVRLQKFSGATLQFTALNPKLHQRLDFMVFQLIIPPFIS